MANVPAAQVATRATRCGFTFAGRVRCRRRSPASPTSRKMRCIVEREHRYRPSSSSIAQTCATARSRYFAESSTARTSARSSSVSAFGGVRRGFGGPSTGGLLRR